MERLSSPGLKHPEYAEYRRRVPMIVPARPKGEAAADRAPGSDVAVVGVGRGLESASRLPVVVRDCAGAGYLLL